MDNAAVHQKLPKTIKQSEKNAHIYVHGGRKLKKPKKMSKQTNTHTNVWERERDKYVYNEEWNE